MILKRRYEDREAVNLIVFTLSTPITSTLSRDDKEGSTTFPTPQFNLAFSHFRDYSVVVDNFQRSRAAYANEAKNIVPPAVEQISTPSYAEEKDISSTSSFAIFFSPLICIGKKTIATFWALLKKTLIFAGMRTLLTSFILILLFAFVGSVMRRAPMQPDNFPSTRSLLNSLAHVSALHHQRHEEVINDFQTSSIFKKEALGSTSSELWLHRLHHSAAELAQKFIFAQLQMTKLRQRRADRLLSPNFDMPTTGETSVSFTVKTADLENRVTPSFSWVRHTSDSGLPRTVQYQEQATGEQVISQVVVIEEAKDRKKCLQLASELVEIVELAEETFSQFISVLFSDILYRFSTGEAVPHQWSDIPEGVLRKGEGGTIKEREKHYFDAELVLKVIRARRHMESLFHLNPLESNEKRRRIESEQFSRVRQEFLHLEEYLMRQSTINETARQQLLVSFYKNIVLRNSTTLWSSLRNNVDELLFWHSHKRLWESHVSQSLFSFSSKEEAEVRPRNRPSVSLFHSASSPASLQWRGLPMFRGLLCFTTAPQLIRGGVDAMQSDAQIHHSYRAGNDEGYTEPNVRGKGGRGEYSSGGTTDENTTTDHSPGAAAELGSEYPFEFAHTEAAAFQQLTGSVMERWITEFELFLEGLRVDGESTDSKMQRLTPYSLDPSNSKIWSHLFRIASDNVQVKRHGLFYLSSFFRWGNRRSFDTLLKKCGMTLINPSLHSVYTTSIGLSWDSLKDVPYIIMNTLLLEPPKLASLKSDFENWILWIIVIILFSIAAFFLSQKFLEN